MEKESKILEKVYKFWQLHNKCMMVVLAIILVGVVIGWVADRCTNSYRYLGTASIVLSIVLSLVVIGYTLAQNVMTDINADRMGRLIERLEQRILRVGEDVSKILSQQVTQVTIRENEETTSDDAKQVGKGEVFFSLLATSDISRLFAYFLLRSYTVKKLLPIGQFVPIVDPIVKMSTAELSSHVYGILHGMACCLIDFLTIENQSSVKLRMLPKNFEHHLKIVTLWMKKRDPRLAECLNQIDNIV